MVKGDAAEIEPNQAGLIKTPPPSSPEAHPSLWLVTLSPLGEAVISGKLKASLLPQLWGVGHQQGGKPLERRGTAALPVTSISAFNSPRLQPAAHSESERVQSGRPCSSALRV